MLDLLNKYSLNEIIVFIIMLAFAIKGALDLYDYFIKRISQHYEKKYIETKEDDAIYKKIDALETSFLKLSSGSEDSFKEDIKKVHMSIDLLIESDKNDIKAWITEKHHYFCYQIGYIDDYSLDCMERRYSIYKEEKGNSFVTNLMNEVRSLPKVSSTVPKKDTK